MTDPSNFRYQTVVAVSENFYVKIPVVDNVLFSHEQGFYPTTSLMKTALSLNFKQIATFTWICDKRTLL